MDERDEGGEWNNVPAKKNFRNMILLNERNSTRNIMKFFITNLPVGCRPWDVLEFMKVFGDISGVYIARKPDKVGRKFGLISFFDVNDVKEMERA
ncbi:putative RNA recognition motif domain, nucleotide-binding alpha-beta plait domain superfamily [Helianthus anomalus]